MIITVSLEPANQPLAVSITSPTDGATFAAGATVSIAATATNDDGTVAKLEFFQNGTLLGEDTTAPYGLDWPNVPAGSHTQRVLATGNQGATGSADVTINVTAGGGTPTRVWIAASSGTRSGVMAVSTDYAADSLTGQLVYPNTDKWNTSNNTQADAVSYAVDIPSAGKWCLWARMYHPGNTDQ